MLTLSVIFISFALVFYTLGIWSAWIASYLKPWHVAMFWTGLAFDISGTLAMHFISIGPFNILEPHTMTGQIAIWLMLAHAVWATYVIRKKKVTLRRQFHRYSLFIWLIWLIPYFGGMWLAMGK
ncbi:MAG: TIGR03987 family protein [Bacteroidetes bacterium]|nr:TIGR03987 family protein [Bacteroidota bacterium]